jgi:hypothetical protein
MCLQQQPIPLTEDLTWMWIWDSIDLAKRKLCLKVNKSQYTVEMMRGLVGPIANKFSEIMQRDDRYSYGSSEKVRSNPNLKQEYLLAYKISEVNQDHRRIAPLPPRPHLMEARRLAQEWREESISLPDGPHGTYFAKVRFLTEHDIGPPP